MSNLNTTPVIVVTEEKKRRRGLIWVAAGAAAAVVAAGGGTFALWSDSASFSGGTITAGDLDLTLVKDTAFYDISPDRQDIAPIEASGVVLLDTSKHDENIPDGVDWMQNEELMGHAITKIADWRMVPGDTVAAVAETEVTLVGDNLVAELSVDPGSFTRSAVTDSPAFADDSLTYTYTLFDSAGKIIEGYDHQPMPSTDFAGHLAYFSAPQDGQAAGETDAEDTPPVIDINTVGANGVARITVVIEAAFDDVDGRTDVKAAEALGSIKLSLDQLRAGTEATNGDSGVGKQNHS